MPRYSLVVEHQERKDAWRWEILRSPEPLGVKYYGEDFQSEHAAKFAGESALRGLLQALDQEQRMHHSAHGEAP